MLYILAIISLSIAVLLTGRRLTALLNLGLTFLIWIPGVIHAFMVVSEHKADKRLNRLVDTFNQ